MFLGSSHFPNNESILENLLEKLKNVQNSVIATGGGIILRENNQVILKQIGKQVYLKVPKEVLLKRLKNDRSRPLLRGENPEVVLNKMFKVQNSSGLKISISCSLSVSNLRATDWTLPADFEPGNLVHNIGEILKPTK